MPAVDQSRGLGTSAPQPCGVQPPSPLTSHGSPEGLGFQQPDRASFSRPTTRPQDPGAELRPRRSASPAVPCACDAAPQGGRGVPALLHPVRSLGETRGDIVGLAAPASPSQDPIAPQDTGGHRLGLACDRSILRGLAGFPVGGGGGRPNTGSGRGGEEGRGKGPRGKRVRARLWAAPCARVSPWLRMNMNAEVPWEDAAGRGRMATVPLSVPGSPRAGSSHQRQGPHRSTTPNELAGEARAGGGLACPGSWPSTQLPDRGSQRLWTEATEREYFCRALKPRCP